MSRRPKHSHLLSLPAEIQLNIMTHLFDIYTLKNLLDAFPDELFPVFRPYAKSVLNAIFWGAHTMQRGHAKNDERGVVYRWMLRSIQLEHLMDNNDDGENNGDKRAYSVTARATTTPAPAPAPAPRVFQTVKYQDRTRHILCDDNDID